MHGPIVQCPSGPTCIFINRDQDIKRKAYTLLVVLPLMIPSLRQGYSYYIVTCTAVAMQRRRDRRIYKAVSGQRLRKHRNNRYVSMWFVPRCYKKGPKLVDRKLCTWCCEDRTWRISTVRSRCQGTTEDIAASKRLSGCCGNLWIVEISDGAVITCSSEWCV
jgi:hypothetical protein